MSDFIIVLILLVWGLLGLSLCAVGIAFVVEVVFDKDDKKFK